MNIINMAVKRVVTVAMVFLCIVLLGAVSLSKVGLDLFPSINFPMAIVMTTYPGAGSEEVEEMVTKPLESVLGTVQGVDSIDSISSFGNSIIMVTLNWGTDLDFASLKMREKVDLIKGYFPENVDEPMVVNMDPSMIPIVSVGISGGTDLAEMKRLADEVIKPRLERQDGVASVEIIGGYDDEVQIELDPVRLDSYGLSMESVSQALAANNFNLSAGSVVDNNKETAVRVLGKYKNIQDIENTIVNLPTGANIYLKDLGTVSFASNSADYMVWLNGNPGVCMNINKQSDANTVTAVDNVEKALEEMQSALPANVEVKTIFNQANYIHFIIDGLKDNLFLGAGLAILILLLFLRSLRSTLIIALAIPISLISTFVLMFFNDMTLNIMTLGGLALGVGMMVDSSIVILENIQRLRTQGMEGEEAAIKGARQLAMAVVASTLTTVVVFLPVVFTEGLTSIIFKDLALTVTFSLLASMVVALTLVPMLSSKLLVSEYEYKKLPKGKLGKKQEKVQDAFAKGLSRLNYYYRRILRWALNHRRRLVITMVILLVVAFAMLPLIGMEFLPNSDSGEINVSFSMEDGTDMATTSAMAQDLEKRMEQELGKYIEVMFTTVGTNSTDGMSTVSSGNLGEIRLDLVDAQKRDLSSKEVAEIIRKLTADIAGVEFKVGATDSMTSMMGSTSGAVSVTIKGDDLEVLEDISEQLKSVMQGIEGSREITSSLDEASPELQVSLKDGAAAQYGITVGQLASLVKNQFDGKVATSFSPSGGNEYDIRLTVPETNRDNLQDLLDLKISTPKGSMVTLSDIATVEQGSGPININRSNQTRMITVSCDLLNRDLNSFVTEFNKKISGMVLPSGYSVEVGGSYEEMMDSFKSLTLAVLLGIVLIYMVMASLFESLVQPFVIMFSIPTAFIGIFGGLLITNNTLNVSSFIGIIMLMGIVVNNGIILVDYVNTLRRENGLNCREALMTAGPVRLRPILMTALTTILAMVPMAFATGEGADLSRSMAVVVLFGLTTSTFLTLVIVPVVYTIFDKIDEKAKKRSLRRKAKKFSAIYDVTYEEMLVRLEAEKEGKRIAAIKAKWGDDYQSRVAEFKQKALDMEDPDKKEWDFAVKND